MEIGGRTRAGRYGSRRFIRRTAGYLLMSAAPAVFTAGCATVGQVTNLSQPACADEFRQAMSAILAEQGEKAETGDALAESAVSSLAGGSLGPRPFFVASSSGVDYEFFVQKKKDACLLRLYGRSHGFVSYTNNLTYIATRLLARCECAE